MNHWHAHPKSGWSHPSLLRQVAEALATLVAAVVVSVGVWAVCVAILLAGQS